MNSARAIILSLILLCVSTSQAAEPISGRFALTDHNGNAVTEQSYAGRYRLVFFGFTRCPIICPTTMVEVTRVLNELGDRANQVQPLFITIDPTNDTVDVVASYAGHFHPSVVGLTGSHEQIADVAEAFNVTYGRNDEEVYHSSYLYLMDRDGTFLDVFGYGDKAETILATLSEYLPSTADTIQISDAWASEPAGPMTTVIAGFMCIENSGTSPVKVSGASSRNVERIEIHEIVHDEGLVRMKKLDGINIPPKSTVCLKPERTHFMLIGIDASVHAGADIELQVKLESGEKIPTSLPIKNLANTN